MGYISIKMTLRDSRNASGKKKSVDNRKWVQHVRGKEKIRMSEVTRGLYFTLMRSHLRV